jgi:hypothetical protein
MSYEKPGVVVLGDAGQLIQGEKIGPHDNGLGGPVDSDLEQ